MYSKWLWQEPRAVHKVNISMHIEKYFVLIGIRQDFNKVYWTFKLALKARPWL